MIILKNTRRNSSFVTTFVLFSFFFLYNFNVVIRLHNGVIPFVDSYIIIPSNTLSSSTLSNQHKYIIPFISKRLQRDIVKNLFTASSILSSHSSSSSSSLLLFQKTKMSTTDTATTTETIITDTKNTTTNSLLLDQSYVHSYQEYDNQSIIQKEIHVPLSSGVTMQVLLCYSKNIILKNNNNNNNILLFIHGSFHAGWCWMEHYGPYFVNQNTTNTIVIAPSLRGTGGTYAGDKIYKIQIQQHISDLHSLLQLLPQIISNHIPNESSSSPSLSSYIKPTIIAHSFGGIVLMKYLEYLSYEKKISIDDVFHGIILICSVPPSGNGKMTLRYLTRSLLDSYKITVGFAMKRCITDVNLCRDLFFGSSCCIDNDNNDHKYDNVHIDDHGITDDDIKRYQIYFDRDSKATIDLFDLGKQLPSSRTIKDPNTGNDVASFIMDQSSSSSSSSSCPIIIMGAIHDFIVDKEGIIETAYYFGQHEDDIIYINSPHDIMLGNNWINGAQIIQQTLYNKNLWK